jgi:hypothetical protein
MGAAATSTRAVAIDNSARFIGVLLALRFSTQEPYGLFRCPGSAPSSRSQDYQSQKQVKRTHKRRQLQDKLVGDQLLTPERGEEIANTMADVLPGSRLLMAAFLRAFPLKDDSASAPQDQHNLI